MSDASAIRDFIVWIDKAEREMLVRDHGNFMEGAVYNSTEVIECVQRKLDMNSEFNLWVCFDVDDPILPFRKHFHNHPRVHIHAENNPTAETDPHYKIRIGNDGTMVAYLSRHRIDVRRRLYQTLDCSRVRVRTSWLLMQRYLRHHREVFKREPYRPPSLLSRLRALFG